MEGQHTPPRASGRVTAPAHDFDHDFGPSLEELAHENARIGRPAPPFPVVRIMDGPPPTPPSLLVDDLLVAGDLNVFTGHGGHGKSTVALHIAIAVALGRPVFGTRPVHRSGAVLLVLPEDGEANARMILDALASTLTEDERERLTERLVMVRDDQAVNLVRDAVRLRLTATAHDCVLVVLDPLRNLLHDADENDNAIAGSVIDALRREVCRGAGATILLTMHNRKPGKDSGSGGAPSVHDLRGAGGWANAARLVWSVTKRDHHLTLSALKANRLRADLRHEVELTIEVDPDNPAAWRSCRLADANAGEKAVAFSPAFAPGKGRPLNANELRVLTALDDRQEPGARSSWSKWRDASGLNENTFKSVKTRLLDAGLACGIPTGKTSANGGPAYVYSITDLGRTALRPDGEGAKGEGVSEW